ncbi:hypothetical protein X797_010293 [Metarhizium robertsii]|uniref:Uncharacterized protein n=1 Tax=Metarhizium robertsii TaxID=568076 RepID=A0A014N908_9HYPO|nr:hypothetical protein X797_010293 [Metarhizium robertsii]
MAGMKEVEGESRSRLLKLVDNDEGWSTLDHAGPSITTPSFMLSSFTNPGADSSRQGWGDHQQSATAAAILNCAIRFGHVQREGG